MAEDDEKARADDKSKGKGKSKSKNSAAYRPMRTTLTALGVGAGWAALHMPSIHGLSPSLVTWLINALIAALAAKAALELLSAAVGWCVRSVVGLF
ncbi:hypothetical protein ACS8Y6_05915 [Salinisphaera sp. RV14]|uniref:hypothetical protein n=1 Tax=unclassified Salinisphaera TaxID=2649847 RepID=UPI003F850875